MSEPLASKGPNGLRRMLPGLLVTALAIAALLYFVDLGELRHAFDAVRLDVLPPVLLLFAGTLTARALAWRTILVEQAGFKDSFLALNQGYLLNNVLPFRLGELGRALLLGQRIDLPFWQVFSSIVVERVFDLGIAAGLLLATVPLVVGGEAAYQAAWISGCLVLAGFAALFALAANPDGVSALLNRLTTRWPRAQAWLGEKLGQFLQGLPALRSPARFLKVAGLMLLTWALNIAWYYVLMRSFFPESNWLWAAFSIGVVSVGVALPSSPAYVGVLEAAMVAALSLFGADPAHALAYAIVSHVIYLILTGVLGIYGFWQQGQSLGGVYNQLLNRSGAK
ncbi:MAG: flippase-like domain-containing protein [Anaerolineales bacterium]|nr:flippase-like domain-containing protein [Anaerolineales bacterium]